MKSLLDRGQEKGTLIAGPGDVSMQRSHIVGLRAGKDPLLHKILDYLHSKMDEKTAYITVIIGMLGDQLSTRIGLMKPGTYESNLLTADLIVNGLWLAFDSAIVVGSIFSTALFIRLVRLKGRWAFLFFPLIFGVGRIIVTIWNLILLIS